MEGGGGECIRFSCPEHCVQTYCETLQEASIVENI